MIAHDTHTHTHTHTLTSGLLVSLSSGDTLNSPERDLALLEEAGKMTQLMHVNVIYTLGLTIIMNTATQKIKKKQKKHGCRLLTDVQRASPPPRTRQVRKARKSERSRTLAPTAPMSKKNAEHRPHHLSENRCLSFGHVSKPSLWVTSSPWRQDRRNVFFSFSFASNWRLKKKKKQLEKKKNAAPRAQTERLK